MNDFSICFEIRFEARTFFFRGAHNDGVGNSIVENRPFSFCRGIDSAQNARIKIENSNEQNLILPLSLVDVPPVCTINSPFTYNL